MKSNRSYTKFSGEYFFQYFALGAFLPLLALYFKSIGLNGREIGTLTSIGSFVTIFSPPFWGIISDRSHKHKTVLVSLMIVCITMFFIMPTLYAFPIIVLVYTLFNIASSALNPLMDGISLHSPIPFGKIRLWGAIGFAVASFVVGKIVEATSLSMIFYIYIIATLAAMAFMLSIKIDLSAHESLHLKDVKALFSNKIFLIFLIYVLLIAGTLGAHNVFFGLLFEEIGGDKATVGFAFLLFAAGEAPFMQLVPTIIRRIGLLNMLLAAPLLGVFRWLLFAYINDPTLHLMLFFIQGMFYAPFLIGIAEYVRTRIPPHLTTSATTIYSAIGFGIGGIIANSMSGILYDFINAKAIYAFYSLLCAIAFFVMLYLYRLDHRNNGRIL